ncbi:histidine phosphatase family protein [Streptomyces sp. MJP52]|uniref:histidine phosphatase family protein n=1 Tax=Streptomyces sp. MJP52 TaxID=2940555 RepID=UPI002473FD5A|nr:histidine phosphatase family protein [Streptomyces sp. MJP52]MDH6228763.1 broad specificity phosphatase PhoE [Streptomyces sp. MJP52]
MPVLSDRFLHLTRHGEAAADETSLTERGRRQATLLGERLRGVPFAAVHHGPLPRTTETAALITARLGGVTAHPCDPAGDYVPHLPAREELHPASADGILEFLASFPAAERERGPRLAREALDRFTGPADQDGPRHELVVTHNFLIGWLVRAALDAPPGRWIGLDHANAGLTVIRYTPDRPPALLTYNDTRHLPESLRWTGLPPELHV